MPSLSAALLEREHPMVVVSHRIRKGREEAFRAWAAGIAEAMAQAPGFLSAQSIPPVEGAQNEWVNVFHFDTPEHLRDWIASSERAQWLEQVQGLVEEPPKAHLASGLEQLFGLKGAQAPKVWKLALVSELGLAPVVWAVDWGLRHLPGTDYGSWHVTAQVVVSTSLCISVMTWAVMPCLTRVFQGWLQPEGK